MAERDDTRRRTTPHFPIWVDDTLAHIAETQEPTLATGARFRLWLIAYRRGGRLRADDKMLAQWAGLSPKDWARVKPYIVDGWIREDETDTYLIRRLAEEAERTEGTSAKARASAEARWQKRECDRSASAMRTQCDGNAPPPPPPPPPPTHPSDAPGKAPRKRGDPPQTVHPAIEAYRQAAHRYPAKALHAGIAEAVGADTERVAKWGSHVLAWISRGWNPANVAGMLETWASGDPLVSSGNGKRQQTEPAAFSGIREYVAKRRPEQPTLDPAMEVPNGN